MHGAGRPRRETTHPSRRPLPVGARRDVQEGRQGRPLPEFVRASRGSRHQTFQAGSAVQNAPRAVQIPVQLLLRG